MRPLLRSLAAAALALSAGAARAGAPRVAVVSLDAPPQLAFMARSVSDAVARKAEGAGYEVLGPAAVERQLGAVPAAALAGCGGDASCLADRGARLGVDRIVGGSLVQRGPAYRVTVVSADARSGARLASVEREIPVASRRLQRDVADAAPALLAGAADATGVLRVVTDPPGAEVTVDDAPAGRSPLERTVRPGRHKVRVALPGHADAEPAWVSVGAGAVVVHHPRLYAIPARDRPNASATEGQGTAVRVEK